MIRLNILKLVLLVTPAMAGPPADSIGAAMRAQRANGHASFQISAEKPDGSEFAFDVVEASNPALTADTVFKHQGSEASIGNGVLHTLLVADTSSNAETFALLAVDADDNVHGIVDPKGSKPMKIKQEKGKKATAEEESNLVAPDWKCGADHMDAEGNLFHRELEEGHHDHEVSFYLY